MVTMSAIWDRAALVLSGRGRMLAGIAALLLFLPMVAMDAATAYGGGGSAPSGPAAGAAGLVGRLAVAILAIWGNLALVAAATDPLVDRPAALAAGARRLAPGIGLSALILLVLVLASLPPVLMLAGSGVDVAALALGTGAVAGAPSSPGLVFGAGLYLLLLAAGIVWLGARLSLFWPVVANERLGVGAFARSFALTRGLTWRIVGVSILFLVLLLVALGAAQAVVSVVARLLLGPDGVPTARFLGAVAGAVVSTGGAVVSATFVSQLYRVVSGRETAHPLA